MSGKPPNFSAEQIQALRRALKEFHTRKSETGSWSQELTGTAIGVSQQVAGRLLGTQAAGLAFPTAQAIAKLEGFDSLEEFFAAHHPSSVDATKQRGSRDLGILLARRAGVKDVAIDNVLSRYSSTQYDNRKTKWWVEKFIAEDNDLDDRGPSAPPPPAPQPHPAQVTARPRAKKSA